MKQFLIAAASVAALALAAPAALSDSPMGMSDAERDAFRAEVRDYLLEHPEVLLEAIEALEARQATEQAALDRELVAANAEALFRDGHSWVGGNPDGAITLVEFMDYRCGYCRRAFDEVEALVAENDDIRFVVKEFPILGEQSVLAARMAIATQQVAGPEAYKRMHDTLMTYGGEITPEALVNISERLDLDTEAIMAAMDSDAVTRVIAENHALAQRLQISGTPAFVLNESMHRGFLPQEQMQALVEEMRSRIN